MNGEAALRTVYGPGAGPAPRRMLPLGRAEALRLLGTVSLGRLVFTHRALPAVVPAVHLMDGQDVVVRLHDGAPPAAIEAPADTAGVVVAYEADGIDPETHLGWGVVVTGYGLLAGGDGRAAGLAARLRPWVSDPPRGAGGSTDAVLRIRPDMVTGFRLTE
ncbi:putative protein [Streptomyces sp. enrichment culture]|uniref:pyridoxamine 5'-phosphate oxidase family protein n=1 Tax=Streptomyces TaxID=1883 RepID=UPI00167A0386|nr:MULTISPECIES: pyridoxamine 5'-phosphate oxidase family protein [Streptomyces]MBD3577577.1 pyridoxamine 5'-phosphate oxidase family protein [Streptomyces sp. KD18]GGT09824.1 hypothetical protein GCM10010286_39160 [Streptomyces toxytricini]